MAVAEWFQNEWELQQLVNLVQRQQPKRVLEIGAMYGGTLQHWLGSRRRVVVVDDEMRRADEWLTWADIKRASLYLLQGQSQDEELVAKARTLGPYDFIFIDGDHTLAGVTADWENYQPMVREGGMVALHDIVERPGYGVSEVWAQIKAWPGTRWMEIVQTVEHESKCGIGVVWA